MGKFRKKPVVIEAEQFLEGVPLPKGAKATYPRVIFSEDKTMFYITHTDAKDWLSVEKNKEGVYDAYPFAFYNARSGKTSLLEENPELAKLYVEVFELRDAVPYVWVETIHQGQRVALEYGDWVLPEPDGIHFYPCKDEIFKKTYEPA